MRLSDGPGRADLLVRHRYGLTAVLSVAVALGTVWTAPAGIDHAYFHLAALVLTGRPDDVPVHLFFQGPGPGTGPLDLYRAVPALQIGPVPLVLTAPLVLGLPHQVAVVVVSVGSALALPLCLRLLESTAEDHLGPDPRRPMTVLAAGAFACLLWPAAVTRYLHVDDVLLIVAACAGLRVVVRGQWVSGAVLLGVAAGAKPWGVALLPLVLWTVRGRRRLLAPVLAGAVAVLPWAPFVLGSPGTVDALSGFHIFVGSTSPASLVWSGDHAPAWLRPLQVGAGAVAVLLALRAGRPMLALPLVVALRVSTEVQDYPYYFAVLAVAVVAADLSVRGRRFPWSTAAVVLIVHDARWLVPDDRQVAALQAALLLVVLVTATAPLRTGRLRRTRGGRRAPTTARPSSPTGRMPITRT